MITWSKIMPPQWLYTVSSLPSNSVNSCETFSLHCLAILQILKSKTWEKTTETAFPKCSANRCSVKLSNIYRKVPAPDPHLNIGAGLQPATLFRKRTRYRCFAVTIYTGSRLVVLESFSWPFNQNLWKKAILRYHAS